MKAMELPNAAGKRFFVTPGHFNNRQIVDVIRENLPDLASQLPPKDAAGGGFPKGGLFKIDNSRAVELLGLKFRTLQECVVDTIKSLQAVGA